MQIITDVVKDAQKAADFIFMKAALLVVVVVLALCCDGLKIIHILKNLYKTFPSETRFKVMWTTDYGTVRFFFTKETESPFT
jgi:hypothetical protein